MPTVDLASEPVTFPRAARGDLHKGQYKDEIAPSCAGESHGFGKQVDSGQLYTPPLPYPYPYINPTPTP